MSRKARIVRAALILLILLTVLIGLTLRQVEQVRLNQTLAETLWDSWHKTVHEERQQCLSRALAALKAGADTNAYVTINPATDEMERVSWRGWLNPSSWLSSNPPYRNQHSMTALALAILDAEPEGVRALLDRGADVHIKSQVQGTPVLRLSPLGIAVLMRNEKIISLLLDHGADVNEDFIAGFTPLMSASQGGWFQSPGLVRLLIQRGANVSLMNRKGQTALSLVSPGPHEHPDKGTLQILQMLKAAGAKK